MPSLKKASKKTIQQNKLQNLDALGSNPADFVEQESFNVIENACSDFVDRVITNIENQTDMIVTGKITDIEIKVEGTNVNIYAYPHLIYQDKGVNGSEEKRYNTPFTYRDKMPPVSVIKEWIRNKSVVLKGPGEKSSKTPEDILNNQAYAIAKSIQKKGFKPRNIFEKEIPQLVNDIQNQIADFTGEVILASIPDKIG